MFKGFFNVYLKDFNLCLGDFIVFKALIAINDEFKVLSWFMRF